MPPSAKYTPAQIERAKIMFLRDQFNKRFAEGDKVKLNMEYIRSSPDWKRKIPEFRKWCETHADQEFTIEYDPNHKNQPSLVCLAEDETEPKWLFSVIDLMPVGEDDGFLDTVEWVRASLKKKPIK